MRYKAVRISNFHCGNSRICHETNMIEGVWVASAIGKCYIEALENK